MQHSRRSTGMKNPALTGGSPLIHASHGPLRGPLLSPPSFQMGNSRWIRSFPSVEAPVDGGEQFVQCGEIPVVSGTGKGLGSRSCIPAHRLARVIQLVKKLHPGTMLEPHFSAVWRLDWSGRAAKTAPWRALPCKEPMVCCGDGIATFRRGIRIAAANR